MARALERAVAVPLAGYARSLDWALRHRGAMLLVLVGTAALNVYLYSAVPKGFFPKQDTGRLNGSFQGDQSISFPAMRQKINQLMHIVSQVEGDLREGLSYMDVLKATFPAGTVSGAPKIRAIEIIQELEPHKRNLYAGAIGYIGWNGDADTAIAIRTAVIQDGRLHVQAGGGVVFDSDPAKEWEETMNKGRALFRAVAQAAGGL